MCHDTESSGSMSPDPSYYADKAITNQQASTLSGVVSGVSRHSAFHDAHKKADRAAQQHAQATAAIDFFNKHPEFDTFVSLVRSGAIQF